LITTPKEVQLFAHGKHTPESHSKDHSLRGLKLAQKAAVASAVRVQPMATAADVRRSLNIVDKARRNEVYIIPTKGRAVGREVAKVSKEVLSEFSCGEKVNRTEGSLTRMCAKIFIKDLVAEHPATCASLCRPSVCAWSHFSMLLDAFPPAECRQRCQ
jgi:hypothetical protein